MKVLIIIPAYNEEANLSGVIRELRNQGYDYHWLIVNDGSSDGTRELCQREAFSALHLPVNLGIGGGVQTGFLYAWEHGYDAAVQLDGDGQHDPRSLPALLAPLESGDADYVIGSRYLDEGGFRSTALRRAGIRLLSNTIKVCSGVRVWDATSGFRAINRPLLGLFSHHYAQDYPEPEAIIQAAAAGFRIIELPVYMRERQRGKSSITPLGSVYYMVKVMMSIFFNRLIGRGDVPS